MNIHINIAVRAYSNRTYDASHRKGYIWGGGEAGGFGGGESVWTKKKHLWLSKQVYLQNVN